MVVTPLEKNIFSTVLFNKDGGLNVAIKNCMSHFYMYVSTKVTAKLANGNTRYAQGIGIIYVVFLTVPLYIQWD